jgi:type II secretory pathway component GspD/PulD (secretin)
LAVEPVAALPNQVRLEFVDADIRVVVEEVARITGMTFLFDPSRVKGKITVLAPKISFGPNYEDQMRRSAAYVDISKHVGRVNRDSTVIGERAA